YRHQNGASRQEHVEHDRFERHCGRTRPAELSRARARGAGRDRCPQLLSVRFAADRRQVRRAHVPVHRRAQPGLSGRARGLDLEVGAGEVHAIMGPNGSGKSTLAQILAGRDVYAVTSGEVLYEGRDLLAMPADERAREGVFLSFQYPVELPGIANSYFLKAAMNAQRRHRGLPELDAVDFLVEARTKMK